MLRYLLLKNIFTQHEICNSFEVHSVVVKKKSYQTSEGHSAHFEAPSAASRQPESHLN